MPSSHYTPLNTTMVQEIEVGSLAKYVESLITLYNEAIYNAYISQDAQHTGSDPIIIPKIVLSGCDALCSTMKLSLKEEATQTKTTLSYNAHLSITVKHNAAKTTSIAWRTQAVNIQQAQERGITTSAALTGKVIEAAGKYLTIAAERRLVNHIVSDKDKEKREILTLLFYRTRLLQNIELLINQDTDGLTTDQILSKIAEALSHYQDALEHLSSEVDSTSLMTHYPALLPGLLSSLQEDKEKAGALFHSLRAEMGALPHHQHKDFLTDASKRIAAFIRERLDQLVDDAEIQNSGITIAQRTTFKRGELHSCLKDAQAIIRDYEYSDEPLTPAHQMNFASDEWVTLDSRHHPHISLENFLLGICDICEILPDDIVTETHAPSWRNFSWGGSRKSIGRNLMSALLFPVHVINTAEKIIADTSVVETYLLDPLLRKCTSEESAAAASSSDLTYQKLQSQLGENNILTSSDIGHAGHVFWRKNLWETLTNSVRSTRDALSRQWGRIKEDAKQSIFAKQPSYNVKKEEEDRHLAAPPHFDPTQIAQLADCMEKLELMVNEALAPLGLQANEVKPTVFALPPSQPKIYHPRDPLSALVGGMVDFVKFFQDDIFRKHPATGTLIALAYAASGLAVAQPEMYRSIFGTSAAAEAYLNASVWIGNEIEAPGLTQAIAAAFFMAKLVAIAQNTLQFGADSWLVNLFNQFRKNPGSLLVLLSAAYGFGVLVTEHLQIPIVSDWIREQEGQFAPAAQTVAGGKLGVGVYELTHNEGEHHRSYAANILGDTVETVIVLGRVLTMGTIGLSPKPWQDLWHMMKNGSKILAFNAIRVGNMTGQMVNTAGTVSADVLTYMLVSMTKMFSPNAAIRILEAEHGLIQSLDRRITRRLKETLVHTPIELFNERHTAIGLPQQKKSETTSHLLKDLGGFHDTEEEVMYEHRETIMSSSSMSSSSHPFFEGIVLTREAQKAFFVSRRTNRLLSADSADEIQSLLPKRR